MATVGGTSVMQFLRRPEGRIAFEIAGNGPLLICAPGMGDLRSVYRFLVPELVGSGFRVAAMDLRGHGDSDATFRTYDDVSVGRDLIALAEHLGGRAVLVGNSMSAGAAVWAAAEAPDLVAGIVLLGPFVRNNPISLPAMLALRLALMRPWGAQAWAAYYRRLYPGRRPADLKQHQRRIRESLRRPRHWRAFAATTRTSHAPVERRLAAVTAPALVVMGSKDPDFRDPASEADWIAERIGGRLVLVPNAGHYPQAEYPEVVCRVMLDFLSGGLDHAQG